MARSIELQRFYATKVWSDLRWMLIVERKAICARCGKSFANDTNKLIGHHKIELSDENLRDLNIALNQNNIEILCWRCHNYTHDKGSRHQDVFIVWGAPLSGKSTYVRQQAGANDLVLDMDSLWCAISHSQHYDHPEELKPVVFALRDTLLNQIRMRAGKWSTAWVIGGYPRKGERERLASRLGAQLIEVASTREECLQRVAERFPDDQTAISEWEFYVNRWYDEVQK